MAFDIHLLIDLTDAIPNLSALTDRFGTNDLSNVHYSSSIKADEFKRRLVEGNYAIFWDDINRQWINDGIKELDEKNKRVESLSTILLAENAELHFQRQLKLSLAL